MHTGQECPWCVAQQGEGTGQARIVAIPRSREVGQSYLTSIWTTLVAAWAALVIVYREAPQLVRLFILSLEGKAASPHSWEQAHFVPVGLAALKLVLACRSWSMGREPAYLSALQRISSGAGRTVRHLSCSECFTFWALRHDILSP